MFKFYIEGLSEDEIKEVIATNIEVAKQADFVTINDILLTVFLNLNRYSSIEFEPELNPKIFGWGSSDLSKYSLENVEAGEFKYIMLSLPDPTSIVKNNTSFPSEMEIEELKSRIRGMDKNEQMIALSVMPFDVLWAGFSARVLKMQDKLNKLNEYIESAGKE